MKPPTSLRMIWINTCIIHGLFLYGDQLVLMHMQHWYLYLEV